MKTHRPHFPPRLVASRLGHPVVASLVLLALTGCSGLPRNPVPVEDMRRAEIPGMSGMRAWGGQINPDFQADLVASVHQEPPGVFPLDNSGYPIYHGLALSGGGSNGAFGAGILNGWTKAGTRPDFKIVTGVSTGALIAPFAFLGHEYDDQLRTVYTTTHTRDILQRLNILKVLFQGEAFAHTTPLKNLIERHFDGDFLQAVAVAHKQGRRLYVGTTHMDAQALVVWNMGAIASSGYAEALELFQEVVLASSSIPAAFPPVFIEVEVNGQRYDEMHADGGTVSQVFFNAGTMDLGAASLAAGRAGREGYRGTLYVIRNGKLQPEPQQVRRRVREIAGRAIGTMVKHAAFNDLQRIHSSAGAARQGFRYVAIPDDFESKAEEPFDPQEMKRLFELGYEMGLAGTSWQDSPMRRLREE